MMMKKNSIHKRLEKFTVGASFPLILLFLLIFFMIYKYTAETIDKSLETEKRIIEKNIKSSQKQVESFIEIVKQESKILKAMELGKVSVVLHYILNYAKEISISYAAVHDYELFSLGKIQKPDAFFENDSEEKYLQKIIMNKKKKDISILQTQDGIVYIGVAPVFSDYDVEKVIGVVSAGYLVDDTLAKKIAEDCVGEIIFTYKGKIIASTFNDLNQKKAEILEKELQINNHKEFENDNKNYIKSIISLSNEANKDFQAYFLYDITSEKQLLQNMFILFLVLILTLIFFSIQFIRYMAKKIETPIYDLVKVAEEVSNNNFKVRANISKSYEVEVLGAAFNKMLDKIISMNENLEQRVHNRTEELEKSIAKVKQTQNKLIETEKLASLGGLVAGVAHEVNTPIGVCLTAASFLSEKTNHLIALYESDNLSEEEFEQCLKNFKESSEIIVENIKKADQLIYSFKQIAVDQTSEQKRTIELKIYIEQVLHSLHPKWKRTKHVVELTCDDGIKIETYPGDLSQIISNLILNSLFHGFDGIEKGEIKIDIKSRQNSILILYTDNGKGMDNTQQEKIFEPFYTTKRGQGGSGLGMYIVYNIVSNRLQGSIEVSSAPGKGVQVAIKLPKQIN